MGVNSGAEQCNRQSELKTCRMENGLVEVTGIDLPATSGRMAPPFRAQLERSMSSDLYFSYEF